MARQARRPSSLAERVRYLRTLVPDLTQHQLDAIAGLHRGHVWQIEEGNRDNLTDKTLGGLKRVFGVSRDWLADGDGDWPDEDEVRACVGRARAALHTANDFEHEKRAGGR